MNDIASFIIYDHVNSRAVGQVPDDANLPRPIPVLFDVACIHLKQTRQWPIAQPFLRMDRSQCDLAQDRDGVENVRPDAHQQRAFVLEGSRSISKNLSSSAVCPNCSLPYTQKPA